MANLNPTAAAEKWVNRSSAASGDYVAGARATDKDPTALAIAALPRMKQRVIEAIDSGKVRDGLQRAGRAGWLAGIEGKGATNYGTGVSSARAKVEQAYNSLFAYEQAGLSRLASMPSNTDAERIQRMVFWVQYMAQYRKPS
jgi:hypothetical protein